MEPIDQVFYLVFSISLTMSVDDGKNWQSTVGLIDGERLKVGGTRFLTIGFEENGLIQHSQVCF